jgi:serine/threonine protein kinase
VIVPGERVLGRFSIESPLSEREGASSYLAIDGETGERAVVRALRLRGGSWKAVELLEREAKVLSGLSHRGIPRLLSHGHEERSGEILFFVAKEYVPGETLLERVARGPMEEQAVAGIGARAAEILTYLHSLSPPVVHRDIKPSNIVLGEDGEVSLIDFGAVADPARSALGGSTIAGTYGYIAPEQVVGDAGPAADLYALGATLLYALGRRDPASLPREGLKLNVAAALPGGGPLGHLVSQLLEPDPRHRPPSTEVVRARLDAIARRTDSGAPREVGPADAAGRWEEVRAAWESPAVHDAFVAWCAERRLLPFAGQCYREALEARPGDAMAERGKTRVLQQAQALLTLETKVRTDWKRIAVVVRAVTWLVVSAGLLVVLYLWLTRR